MMARLQWLNASRGGIYWLWHMTRREHWMIPVSMHCIMRRSVTAIHIAAQSASLICAADPLSSDQSRMHPAV
jgi:hypothetical protein